MARRLFEVIVQCFGMFIATAFLYGLALSEVATRDLEGATKFFEITVTSGHKKMGPP
jgi:hypothetical protein